MSTSSSFSVPPFRQGCLPPLAALAPASGCAADGNEAPARLHFFTPVTPDGIKTLLPAE